MAVALYADSGCARPRVREPLRLARLGLDWALGARLTGRGWHARAQHPTSFTMWKYLLGFAGPAQCVELVANQPMKIHMVPRAGGPAQARAQRPPRARRRRSCAGRGPCAGGPRRKARDAPAAARCT